MDFYLGRTVDWKEGGAKVHRDVILVQERHELAVDTDPADCISAALVMLFGRCIRNAGADGQDCQQATVECCLVHHYVFPTDDLSITYSTPRSSVSR